MRRCPHISVFYHFSQENSYIPLCESSLYKLSDFIATITYKESNEDYRNSFESFKTQLGILCVARSALDRADGHTHSAEFPCRCSGRMLCYWTCFGLPGCRFRGLSSPDIFGLCTWSTPFNERLLSYFIHSSSTYPYVPLFSLHPPATT